VEICSINFINLPGPINESRNNLKGEDESMQAS
jgi:hypothetical protein